MYSELDGILSKFKIRRANLYSFSSGKKKRFVETNESMITRAYAIACGRTCSTVQARDIDTNELYMIGIDLAEGVSL